MIRKLLAAAACIGMLAATASHAADYPTRPIRLIVGAAVGGASDFVARTLSPKASAQLGQPIVIDNRGGAAGLVAADLVAKAPADGYTLLICFANYSTFPSINKKLDFDPEKDLIPVVDVASTALVLTVAPSLPAKSVSELITVAKGKTLNYASPGVGSMGHLAAELFQSIAGVKMVHVPYKGGGPAITALLGGQVDLYFSTPPAALAQVNAGKLRALAVTSASRSRIAPDLPTISEAGLKDYEVSGWFGVFAPAGTPPSVIEAVNRAFVAAAKDPDVQKALAGEGVAAVGNSPPEFASELQRDIAKWRKVITEAHIQLD
ncbi:MAG TPA: tripartite tricarboxylate transporter substrate binding protein [Casimicrobiaceae bacterium]|nr:tripartite tricarboxylate transporter substrate binding protein [Casimicrobiaceae bacterium]